MARPDYLFCFGNADINWRSWIMLQTDKISVFTSTKLILQSSK